MACEVNSTLTSLELLNNELTSLGGDHLAEAFGAPWLLDQVLQPTVVGRRCGTM